MTTNSIFCNAGFQQLFGTEYLKISLVKYMKESLKDILLGLPLYVSNG